MARPNLLFSAALLFLCMVEVAQPHIGETREQLVKRWGTGKELGYQVLHTSGDFDITVYFGADGRATMQLFARRHAGDKETPALTEEEIIQLLEAQSNGLRWKEGRTPTGWRMWRRSDGKLNAEYKEKERVLMIIEMAAPTPSN